MMDDKHTKREKVYTKILSALESEIDKENEILDCLEFVGEYEVEASRLPKQVFETINKQKEKVEQLYNVRTVITNKLEKLYLHQKGE